VYDVILNNNEDLDLSALKDVKDMFQPIFVGISAAVRSGLWKVVGFLAVENFIYQGFLWPTWDGNPPVVYHWSFWDGKKQIDLGAKLPDEYKKYEYIGGFAAPDVAKRIETGEESFVKKLIAGEIKGNNSIPTQKDERTG
jgi:hypothetical protein